MVSDPAFWMLYTDGGSRGNPGLAAYAFVLIDPAGGIYQEAECIGHLTNNQAEYYALLNGLEAALDLGVASLHVRSDSELMVKQMQGVYQVKNADLREIYQKAKAFQGQFSGKVKFEHVRRELNKRSDELCNMAMDGNPSPKIRGPQLRDAFIQVNPDSLAKASAKSAKPKTKNPPTAEPLNCNEFPSDLLLVLDEALRRAATGQEINSRTLASQLAPWLAPRV